jgi:hypothetical protein
MLKSTLSFLGASSTYQTLFNPIELESDIILSTANLSQCKLRSISEDTAALWVVILSRNK